MSASRPGLPHLSDREDPFPLLLAASIKDPQGRSLTYYTVFLKFQSLEPLLRSFFLNPNGNSSQLFPLCLLMPTILYTISRRRNKERPGHLSFSLPLCRLKNLSWDLCKHLFGFLAMPNFSNGTAGAFKLWHPGGLLSHVSREGGRGGFPSTSRPQFYLYCTPRPPPPPVWPNNARPTF